MRQGSLHAVNPTVASLFSGCGGFDIGFHQQGFRPLAAFDIDPHVVKIYNENVAPVANVCDLTYHTPEITPDVLLAGSPCQGFSTAGKHKPDDPRNELLVRAGKIAVRMKPRVFVLENVPAASSGRHRKHWGKVEAILEAAGFSLARFVAEGNSSGIPQLRKRLFLVAYRGNISLNFSPPICSAPKLVDVLRNVEGLTGHDPIPLPAGSRQQMIAQKILSGQKLSNVRVSPRAVHTWDIPEVFGSITAFERMLLEAVIRLRRRIRRRTFGDADPILPSALDDHIGQSCDHAINRLLAIGYLRTIDHFIDLRHTYNGKFRRLSLLTPSPTVDTRFGNPHLFLHPSMDRGLTPREAARIQGFHDTFKITGSRNRSFRIIGNAVPPPMAARLAAFIRNTIFSA